MPIRAKFKPTPEGEFIPGIPSRDLIDPDDWDHLDKEQREAVRRSPLYEYVPERAAHPPEGKS